MDNNDTMMKLSLHELIIEMKKLTKMCDDIIELDDFNSHLDTIDKLSTILKRFSDMGYSAVVMEESDQTKGIQNNDGKEESE